MVLKEEDTELELMTEKSTEPIEMGENVLLRVKDLKTQFWQRILVFKQFFVIFLKKYDKGENLDEL